MSDLSHSGSSSSKGSPPVLKDSDNDHRDTTLSSGSDSGGSASSPTPSPPSQSQPPPASPPPSSPPPSLSPSPHPSSPPQSQHPPASPPPSQQSLPQLPPLQSSYPPPSDHARPRSPPPSELPMSSQLQPVPITPSPPPLSQSQPRSPPWNSYVPPFNTNTPPSETSTTPPPPPTSQDGAHSPTDGYVSTPLILGPPVDNSSPGSFPQTQLSPSANTSQSSTNTSTPQSTNSSTYTGASAFQYTNSTASIHETFKTGAMVGGSVAGIVAISLFAVVFCFICTKNKKRRSDVHAAQYTPPNHFTVKSDGYYSKQQHNFKGGNGDYETQNQPIHSEPHSYDSYGSQKGGGFQAGTPDTQIGGSRIAFSYEELMEITNGFSRQNILGEGGFGCVYKGVLNDGKLVAVKQLKTGSGQGDREFRAEVEIISRVHHRHLVSLVGYCVSEEQRLLIYEFVPNNTLEHHLHGKGMPVLDWSKRTKIALGAARGLAYLHEDCHPRIIHRDIKAANILLDDAFEAQVADFGLAKLTDDTSTHVSTRVMGTFGYMAPEYASSGKLTDRSDVFSFGVMLLEIVTGRKPVDPTQPLGDESLVELARPLLSHALDSGDMSELVDPKLEKHYVESQMLLMIEAAAACVRHSAPKRPRMKQLARALDWESENYDLSNGVKYGQSTAYDSGQYNRDISRFRKMAFGSEDSSDFNTSAEFTPETNGCNSTWKCGETSSDYTSDEVETRPINPNSSEWRPSLGRGTYGRTGVSQC